MFEKKKISTWEWFYEKNKAKQPEKKKLFIKTFVKQSKKDRSKLFIFSYACIYKNLAIYTK